MPPVFQGGEKVDGMKFPGIPVITTGKSFSASPATGTAPKGKSFQELLNQKISQQSEPLTFSKHAQSRTEQRGISLSQDDMLRLNDAVGKAEDRGLNDTLVFMDKMAFIVNVPKKVVVTVIDSSEVNSTVFTNIDGAVIV